MAAGHKIAAATADARRTGRSTTSKLSSLQQLPAHLLKQQRRCSGKPTIPALGKWRCVQQNSHTGGKGAELPRQRQHVYPKPLSNQRQGLVAANGEPKPKQMQIPRPAGQRASVRAKRSRRGRRSRSAVARRNGKAPSRKAARGEPCQQPFGYLLRFSIFIEVLPARYFLAGREFHVNCAWEGGGTREGGAQK